MRLPSEERDALARGKNQTRTLSGRLRMLHREGAYLIPASLTERRDFLRLAWFGCSRLLEFAAALRIGQFDAQGIELGLQLLRIGELVLFRAPARRQRRRFFFKLGKLLLQRLEARFVALIVEVPARAVAHAAFG